jgi:hypothetical protein
VARVAVPVALAEAVLAAEAVACALIAVAV